jgi:hypothetical protein
MKRKKINIKYRKERAILSDVLPYELPFTFSNRHLYQFLLENTVECRKRRITWKKEDPALDAIIRLLLGVDNKVRVATENTQQFGKTVEMNFFPKLPTDFFESIPFSFKIRHKEAEFRALTVSHPRNQLQIVDFYDTYKELILYYCSASPFSIRRPSRISKCVFHKDKLHYKNLSGEAVGIEEYDKEYESLRSFFVYKKYSYIFKFYESYDFHRCEKKYDKLIKLDIYKCFDSIYTHSLPWALLGRETVKEQRDHSEKTFAGVFDRIMRQINYSETNGIIIGPEFSRVFAELILQSIDRTLYLKLRDEPFHYFHKRDYEIFRFVDDYFVFYNDDKVKDVILRELREQLKTFRLNLNTGKMIEYAKPMITSVSIAKNRIAELLDGALTYTIKIPAPRTPSSNAGVETGLGTIGYIKINSNHLITQFKSIVREAGADHKDTLNYTLAIVEGRITQILKDYRAIAKSENSERELGQAILAICDFTFFIYSLSPRANTTIRLCRVLNVATSALKRKGASSDVKHSVFQLIFDNISLILRKNTSAEYAPIETLYLLIALSDLGKDYWLDIETLCSYFDFRARRAIDPFHTKARLNYISLVVLLFYIQRKTRYKRLRDSIQTAIKQNFAKKRSILQKDAELTFLLLDTLTCPHIDQAVKCDILKMYGIKNGPLQQAIIRKRQFWFTKWTGFDLGKELDAKQSLDVY